MAKKRRYHTFLHRLVCFMMGLHILNLSIDAPDQYAPIQLASNQQEDLSINDIESFAELVFENFLGIENAIPEQDDPDEDSNLLKLKQDYVFTTSFVFAPTQAISPIESPSFTRAKSALIPTPITDVISPPPQFS